VLKNKLLVKYNDKVTNYQGTCHNAVLYYIGTVSNSFATDMFDGQINHDITTNANLAILIGHC